MRRLLLAALLALAVLAGPVSATTTTYRIAVVLINFTNNTSQPFTPASAAASMFTATKSVVTFYAESSFGKVAITGQVFGWWTVPYPNTPCDTAAWKNAATSIALAQGVDLEADFDHVALAWPYTSACRYTSRAGSFYNVSGSALRYQSVIHEFGHSLSLGHANARACTSDGMPIPLSATCTNWTYGDYFDTMGNESGHWFSTYFRSRLGWIDSTLVVSASGQYTLGSAQDPAATDPQLIMVPRSDGTWFALEYRRPAGVFEQWTRVSDIDGVFIRIAPYLPGVGNSPETFLLDMSPTIPRSGFQVVLVPGQSFSYDGVTIATVSIGPASAVIDVTVP